MMKRAVIFIISLLIAGCSVAQQQHTSISKKAVRYYETARLSFKENDLDKAEELLLKAIDADDKYIEAYQALAQIYFDRGNKTDAINLYVKSLEIEPDANPNGYRIIAAIAFDAGQYERAEKLIDHFLSYSPETVNKYAEGEAIKEKCRFAIKAVNNPVPFQPVNLGDSINSNLYEYWPSLSVDEKVIFFTVLLTPQPDVIHEDFFYSNFSDGHWQARKNLGPPINTSDNEGAQTITADGKHLYFTACNRRDGKGKCDIYHSELINGKWSIPKNLGSPVNTPFGEKHPSVSADGRRLYFSSDRRGGKGGNDIWMSQKEGNAWGAPLNLGDSVNTSGMEWSPFIHPDQHTLYFSSDGWPGMGQGDLFKTRRIQFNSWEKPENLGYPINTFNDEVGLIVNARGDRAYFSSNRHSGSDTDIYTFELPVRFRPVHVSYMKGRVFDAGNMKGLEAVLQLIDIETEEVVMELESNSGEGDYLISLPTDRDYALNVSKPGYVFYSDHFAFADDHGRMDPFTKDVPLQRLKIGSSIVLNNIFFDLNAFTLKDASIAELNKVYDFLKNNQEVKVEISGHTDNTGDPDYNMDLSDKRANAVVNYLIEKGISAERLIPKGFGADRPLAENTSEEGRSQNRRTELTITSL